MNIIQKKVKTTEEKLEMTEDVLEETESERDVAKGRVDSLQQRTFKIFPP